MFGASSASANSVVLEILVFGMTTFLCLGCVELPVPDARGLCQETGTRCVDVGLCMSSPGLNSFCDDGQQAPFDHGQRVNDASESGVSDNGAVFDMAESFVSEESGASCANDEECGNGFCGQSQTCVECRANRVQFETSLGNSW